MSVIPIGSRAPQVRRVALLSSHPSPLDQPGTGDAGGMNVYVDQTARRLARAGVEVEIFTRSTGSHLPPVVEIEPGVIVRHVTAGPYEGMRKEDLPGQLCAVTSGVLRTEASRPAGWYDVVHSHYWLSGQVGWLVSERWGVPLVHSMHTMAKVKNLELAENDSPEPMTRVIGEQQVVDNSARLIANTNDEARQLIDLYGAPAEHVDVVHPGVDLDLFTPGDQLVSRRKLGIPERTYLLLFVGRIQPLKAPDVLVQAVAHLIEQDPTRRQGITVAILGGPSGSGLERPEALVDLARQLGVADVIRFEPPSSRDVIADWFRAADLTIVPSHSESFGLVALESQACGTPVVAAAVGGLHTAVADGTSGVLIQGHDPAVYAQRIATLLDSPRELSALARGARAHAESFSWSATTAGLMTSYANAIKEQRGLRTAIAE